MQNEIILENRATQSNTASNGGAVFTVVNGVPYIRTDSGVYAIPVQNTTDGISSGEGFFVPTEEVTIFTQTYAIADPTLGAYTPNSQAAAFTTTGATTDIASKADLNTLRVAVENLRAFTEDLARLVNSVIDNEQALGIAG